ncbi:MAG: hypothetical protein O3A29_22800 [Planctomycetota bacterium]|nr:hypothetical protein [Planctomycetota bacterium]
MTPPVLQALVLADQIYVDRETGKKVIAGTFNALISAKFPSQFERKTWAYICLTEVSGKTDIVLRYVDLDDNSVLLESPSMEVNAASPLHSVEVITEIPPFPMPKPGTYAFEVYTGDDLLGSLRVTVNALTEKQ